MSALIDYIFAMREIAKAQSAKRKKDALYKVLVGQPLNFMILKDIVNAAVHDVVIDITFKNNENETARLQIRREKPLVDKPPDSDLYL